MELILVSTGSCLFWRIFMVSVITTVGIAQAVWQFSLQMLPYQFLLQGHDKLSNSVLWNSLNDISRFNFLMLLTIWLDRATILRMRHSCLWKETLMSSWFWLVICPLHLDPTFATKNYLEMSKQWKASPLPAEPVQPFIGILSSANQGIIWCCCSLLWCFGRFLQLNY